MDFALLNVNDKSFSKSTPNLAARRASDVGPAAAAIAADGREKELKQFLLCTLPNPMNDIHNYNFDNKKVIY